MENKELEKVMALAGVCQAAALVQQASRTGQVDQTAFETSISSIVITQPEHTEQVFGSLQNLRLGLTVLESQLSNRPVDKDAEITRYVASLLGLERKLSNNKKKLDELSDRIGHIQRQQTHLDLFETQMLSNLANIYSDVVSPIGPRIQVAGTPALLKQANNQHKVRALLLAGLRAAVLWRQLGGKRRSILFNRKNILSCAEQALQQINQLH
jgi:high frequency lysogenization protein